MFNAPILVLVLAGLLIAIYAAIAWEGEDGQIWTPYASSFIPHSLAADVVSTQHAAP